MEFLAMLYTVLLVAICLMMALLLFRSGRPTGGLDEADCEELKDWLEEQLAAQAREFNARQDAIAQQNYAAIRSVSETLQTAVQSMSTTLGQGQDSQQRILERRLQSLEQANNQQMEQLRRAMVESMTALQAENTRKLDEITFDEMLELASLGAQVLNNRSVELAKKYNVELEVLSSLNPVPGTVVKEVTKDMEGMLIKGVAKDTDVAVITILNVPDEPGMSFKIFGLLAQKNINVDIILQSTGRDGKKDISFTCSEGEADLAMRVLKESAHFNDVSVDTTCAKVSIVGAGMQSHSGVASKMFEALSNNNINIKMISTSEIKISCIINRDDADKAVSAIHDMLFD